MKDPITVPADTLFWALDRLAENGLEDTPEFQELEEATKQVKYEYIGSGSSPTAH